jgi:dextranase
VPLTLIDAYPEKAVSAPGAPATLVLEVRNDGDAYDAALTARLRDAGVTVAEQAAERRVAPGVHALRLQVDAPAAAPRGYEALLELEAAGARVSARTALLVLEHWWQAPRYGFLTEFAPGEPAPDRIRELAKFHVSVVQFYDWMYRHYAFLPPEDEFVDALGRRLSLRTVMERVRACQEHGMAALGYGAVYGAEPEFILEHPDWVLSDADGRELSLERLFYVTDLRPGAPWRDHILREFEASVARVGFDGIHMDQYGFPKWSYDAAGEAVDMGACFPGLIDEAAQRVASTRDGAAVVFNAVNDWPVAGVARSEQAAVYIEVWPPHDRYRDLVDLIRRARDLSGKQAVLAAYVEAYRDGGPGAEASTLLTTAVIAAAGGHHLLLGEGDGVLRDPYFVNHGRLDQSFVPTVRRYYDHTAALHHYLHAGDLEEASSTYAGGINTEVRLAGAPASTQPQAGTVWLSIRTRADLLVVNLVNLIGVEDDCWNAAKERPRPQDGLALGLSRFARVRRVVWASPDGDGPATELPYQDVPGQGTTIALPSLEVWGTVLVELT